MDGSAHVEVLISANAYSKLAWSSPKPSITETLPIIWSNQQSTITMSDTESTIAPPEKVYEPIREQLASPQVTRTHTNGSRIHRTNTNVSQKEARDPNMDVNLPYRTLTSEANLNEYNTESARGEIVGRMKPDGQHHYKLVTFTPNDPENPKNWSKVYKWYCTMVVAVTCFVVAFASSVITADLIGVQEEFHVSEEVALVSITVFVVGFGVGEFFFGIINLRFFFY